MGASGRVLSGRGRGVLALEDCAITTTAEATLENESAAYRFAVAAAEMAANTRCEDVVVLDLRGRSPVTEFFVIATGTSNRQTRTVADELSDLGKRSGFAAWQTSGYETAKWIVVDFVQVVAHIFEPDSRAFYDLELLWGDCPRINWRAALGLPEEPHVARSPVEVPMSERFGQSSGEDINDAEAEEARLEGRDLEEEGDADMDEDVEMDEPVVTELPDLSTGSNSVEFVEIDPPAKRRGRGKAVFPTPIADADDAADDAAGGTAGQSVDEDEQEAAAERARDEDVEAISAEDLPPGRLTSRPMGGVSAGMSSTTIAEDDEEQQRGSHGELEDVEQDHRDEVPPAHEAAAEAVKVRKGRTPREDMDLTTEMSSARPSKKKLTTRKDMAAPTQAAPTGTDAKKAKAGVVKAKQAKSVKAAGAAGGKPTAAAKRRGVTAKKMDKAPAKSGARKPNKPAKAASKAVAKSAGKSTAKKTAAAKAAGKKGPAKKAAAKKTAPKAVAKKTAKAAPKKAAAKKAPAKAAAKKASTGKAAAKKAPAKKPPAKKPAAKKTAAKKPTRSSGAGRRGARR